MNSKISIILTIIVLAGVTTLAAFTWQQRNATMRAPKYIAAFVCLLLVFTLFQGLMWPARPEPGWQPSWWQSKTWATFGFIFAMPAMIPTLLVEEIGFVNIATGGLALVVGFIMEFVSVYALVYFPTRFVFRRIYDFRAHKTVV